MSEGNDGRDSDLSATRPSRRWLGKIPVATFSPLLATIGSNATIQAGAVLGSILLARRLGPETRGEFAGAAAWCALLTALGDFGVSQAVPFRCARERNHPGRVVGTSLTFGATTGSVAALIGAFGIVPLLMTRGGAGLTGLSAATLAFLPSIPASLLSTYAAAILQGLGAIRTFNAIRLAESAAYAGGMIGSVLLGAKNAATILLVIAGLQALVAAGSILAVHRHTTARAWRVEREEGRHLLHYGIRTHLGNLAWMANGKLDQMIMSVTLSTRDLGYYANAASYASALASLLSALGIVVFPKLAAEKDAAERLRNLRRSLGHGLRLSLALGLVLAVAAPWLIPWAFGRDFAASVPPAIVLVGGNVLLCMNYLFSVGLRAAGRPLLPSFAEGSGLIITAVGLPLVLSRFGILGAAWVSDTAYLMTSILLFTFFRRMAREASPAGAEVATV